MDTTFTTQKAAQVSFIHREVGELRGITRPGRIAQFRGIPYANIPARFRQAVLRTSLPQVPFDATEPGPTCPHTQALPFPDFWSGPLSQDGIELQQPAVDELKCLNLNITASLDVLQDKRGVPVLVFIHGGAFLVGSSSLQVAGREIFDAYRLVQSSAKLGQPIIVVTINYRVGPLGFLASAELDSFNKSHGEAAGNYGLHDQRQALEWVYKFIDGFGGDPRNITVQGGSAGGASCHFQSTFRDNKLKRAILSSGTSLAIGAMPLDYHQKRFDAIVRDSNISGTADVVAALQTVPWEDLVEQQVTGFFNPVIDNDWIRGRTMTDLIEHPTSVELMIGSCAYEQDLSLSMLGAMSLEALEDDTLRTIIRTMLTPIGLTSHTDDLFSPEILEAYGINDSVQTPSQNLEAWAVFVADLIFRIPPFLIALKNSGSRAFVYDFQGTNPYPGWKLGYGKANHSVSDMFFFNPASDLVQEQHESDFSGAVDQLQRDWISFCYGKLNWEAFAADDFKKLGPVYTFVNGGDGKKFNTLEDLVGEPVASRWRLVLEKAQV